MKICMEITQRIHNTLIGYDLCPFIGVFMVRASSCFEAIEMVETSMKFKAIPGAYISGITIVEKEDLLFVNMEKLGEQVHSWNGEGKAYVNKLGEENV